MRRWLRVAAIVASIAIGLGIAAPAAIAAQPGESSTWYQEVAGGSQIEGRGEDEARSPDGTLVEVWRGFNNNEIYVSVNNGAVWRWVSTLSGNVPQTYARPRVVWTEYGFRVWHTGTDGHIYYAGMTINNGQVVGLGEFWQAPSNVVTRNDQPPAVVGLPGGESVYLAWVGSNSNQLYGLYYDGNNHVWHPAEAIPGATSPVAPNLAFNRNWSTRQLALTWAGEDHNVYIAWQLYGNSSWTTYRYQGRQTASSPSIAFTDNGHGQLVVTPYVNGQSGGGVQYTTLNSDRTWNGVWTPEITSQSWQYTPNLVAWQNVVYSIAVAYNGYIWWKASGDYGK